MSLDELRGCRWCPCDQCAKSGITTPGQYFTHAEADDRVVVAGSNGTGWCNAAWHLGLTEINGAPAPDLAVAIHGQRVVASSTNLGDIPESAWHTALTSVVATPTDDRAITLKGQ